LPRRDKYENASSLADLVEGNLNLSTLSNYTSQPNFRRMVVLEVISDPNNILDQKKFEYWRTILKVSNIQYASSLPRNTIVAQPVKKSDSPMFVFPFFPSHLSLPCKPGETVWTLFEDTESSYSDIAYWFCKITELQHAEDVNHTHAPRSYEKSMGNGSLVEREKNDGKTDPHYELRNGEALISEGSRTTNPSTLYIANTDENIFEKLTSETDAAALMQYESVPRFRKRPGDVALEGTNNTLIVLGTDRGSSIADYKVDSDKNSMLTPVMPSLDLVGSAGSIDIVAGRGQTKETSGNIVTTTSVSQKSGDKKGIELNRKELGKSRDSLVSGEGDPDYANDRSRVLVAQRTKVDQKLGISDYNSAKFSKAGEEVKDRDAGDAAVVIKSDKVRIFARTDVQILVSGADEAKSPDGQSVLKEKKSTSSFASITIKKNGDIVFSPSESGYIKLGSDSADKAILCTDAPANKSPSVQGSTSTVLPIPINTTPAAPGAPSLIGTGLAGQGTWAKKVLVD
jgi:hypothetical protein